jgi:hypothetical protein
MALLYVVVNRSLWIPLAPVRFPIRYGVSCFAGRYVVYMIPPWRSIGNVSGHGWNPLGAER